MTFDTLTYARKLKEAGFTEQQAEAQAEALLAVVEDNLATKRDIAELRTAMQRDIAELHAATQHDIAELRMATKRDIAELRAATQHDIAELRAATQHDIELLRRDLKEMESRIVVRLGGLIVVAVGVLAVLVKIL